MEFRPLAANSPHLQGHANPDIMAIGDSIFNGVRSLTISEDLAAASPPAFVARGLGLQMVQPDYRRPLLFDLEQELRDGIDLGRLYRSIVDNAERWLEERGEWSNHRFFDNISVAGFAYRDMHVATAGFARAHIRTLVDRLKMRGGLDFNIITELYMALNIAFVLNPTSEPELDDLTQLEQVASRRPKRLLINIGNNEGLFGIGISASFSRTSLQQLRMIPELAKQLAEVLKTHCAGVGKFYFNTLLRPRVLANLAPRSDHEMFNPPPRGGYFKRYVARLGSMNGMSADQMKDFDNEIAKVNRATETAMKAVFGRQQDKLVFVDLYKMVDGFDAKHFGAGRRLKVEVGGRTLHMSNYPFSANAFGFRQGGIFSLDNMHPTNVGYALLANTMGKAIAAAEPGLKYRNMDFDDAAAGDTLIMDPPRNIDRIGALLGLLGLIGGAVLG